MNGTLGVGIIGCGKISAACLELAPLFRGIEIRACADIDPAAAETRARAYRIRHAPVAALPDAPDIDIVLNLTVPAAHGEVTRAALLAGKHVYTEKPVVLSLSDGRALADLAQNAGLAEMAQAILQNRPHRCVPECALHVLDVLTSILRAAEIEAAVNVATACERPAPLDAAAARSLLAGAR